MKSIWAMAIKDLKLMLSDKIGFFFVWFYPILFTLFFGYVLSDVMSGGGKGMGAVSIALVDEDKSESSQKFVERLKNEETFYIEDVETREEAIQKVRSAKKPISLIIPEGYGESAKSIFAGEPPQVDLITDPARPMESGLTEGMLTGIGFERIHGMFSDKDMMLDQLSLSRESIKNSEDLNLVERTILLKFLDDSESFFNNFDFFGEQPAEQTETEGSTESDPANPGSEEATTNAVATEETQQDQWMPLRISKTPVTEIAMAGEQEPTEEKTKLSSYSIILPQAIAWGVMACAATFALSLVMERTRGTLPRLMIAPVRNWQILAGKALSCSITTTCVIVSMILLGWLALGVEPVAPLLLIPAVLCTTIGIVGIMMLMSVLGRTEAAVGGMSWAVLVIMAMFGGGMMPLSQMKGFLATLSHFSFFRWTILSLEGAMWRDYTLVEMANPCGVLLAIGIGGFLIGSMIFSRRTS